MDNEKQKYKHSPFDEELFCAMEIFNEGRPSSEKFTLVDARIISLVHSYDYANKVFFASNKYLADKCLSTAATVQKSINKLCLYNLIRKKVSCVDGKKQRVLTYNEEGAKKFKEDPQKATPQDWGA
jgi:DNA-binding MarR family transcriptional regulator